MVNVNLKLFRHHFYPSNLQGLLEKLSPSRRGRARRDITSKTAAMKTLTVEHQR